MANVLVAGINGFVGHYLARELAVQGHEVYGLTHGKELAETIKPLLTAHIICDLTDSAAVSKLDLLPYQAIINLAGLANVGASFQAPKLYMTSNVSVLSNICSRMTEQKSSARIVAISTGAVYDPDQPMPLSENSRAIAEGSPYTKSKLAMERQAHKFIEQGVNCIIARPFNHVGPGQRAGFLLHDLCYQLLDTRHQGPVVVGNLASKRDYTDVRDVAQAYILLALADDESLTSRVYNVCSSISRTGQSLLAMLQKHIPGSEHLPISVDQDLIRPLDPSELRGSHELLTRDTGWQPHIPFEQTIGDVVESLKQELLNV